MKKILLVGNSPAFADKLSDCELYTASGCDLREDDAHGLLKFALENDIDLTFAISDKAIKSDIVSVFQANERLIFAPSAQSAQIATGRAFGKKFLYKIHAKTPKFGIFDKLPLALDYLKEAQYPLIVSSDDNLDKMCCTVFEHAKYFVEKLFSRSESKVVIEDYVWGHPFTIYTFTDGYQHIPFACCSKFFFEDALSPCGCYLPDYRVSREIQDEIFKNVISSALNTLAQKGTPYCGILGLDAVLNDEGVSILGFKTFFDDVDCKAVLNSLDEDLFELMSACANGFFADEYEDILVNDNASVSCVLKSKADIVIPPEIDCDIVISDKKVILTACAKTLSRAKLKLKDDISLFSNVKFNEDMLKFLDL